MAYEILSESYGARLPKITAEADSTDDLATLGTNYAEGSTCVIGDKTYSLDKVQGWVEPGSGGGGGGVFVVTTTFSGGTFSDANYTPAEIVSAMSSGKLPVLFLSSNGEVVSLAYFKVAEQAGDELNGVEFVELSNVSGGAFFRVAPDKSVVYVADSPNGGDDGGGGGL